MRPLVRSTPPSSRPGPRPSRASLDRSGGGARQSGLAAWAPPGSGPPSTRKTSARFFIDSHVPYNPADLPWPALDDATRGRLATLPIWDDAVRTEAHTARTVTTWVTGERPAAGRGHPPAGLRRGPARRAAPGCSRTNTRSRSRRFPPTSPQDPNGRSCASATANASTPSSPSACSPSRATAGSSRPLS